MIHYSVIVPAYNEQVWLGKSLPALATAMKSIALEGELLVVDNNSSDHTARVARDEGARVVFEGHNQISRARNTGARHAAGRYLVFVDADTIVSAELLQAAIANLSGGGCCGGGARVVFDHPPPWYARWMPPVWNWFALRFGLAAGCFVYCLRDAFEAIGGFSERVFASEEIWLSRAVRRWGHLRGLSFKVIRDPPILTSARKMQARPLRNFLAFCMVLAFPPAVFSRRLSFLWYRRDGTSPPQP